ncbi:tetratricopeptide repeat protein [Hymenobacter sp. RP-2-7]|uniref:Tetratricopeptide repeat protein n=1 Tax=Hymenobacter polaris TaxID=2682546 RepID=A0A7Y0ADU1_9BACT|nr:DUF6377 domain-containing protein [Hymenobacter polaris]NML65482.1 tetratricopeptide repeat protein [Hymenobacter polaris]
MSTSLPLFPTVFVRICLLFCFLLLLPPPGWAAAGPTDRLLDQLNAVLLRKADYMRQRQDSIALLTRAFRAQPVGRAKFALGQRVFEQYNTFKYDSAFAYALKLRQLGQQLGDERLTERAQLSLAQIHLSAGMFTEAFELERSLQPALLDSASKQAFYFLEARSYSDLADYNNPVGYYRPAYTARAVACLDTALRYCRPGTYDYLALLGFRALKQGDLPRSRALYGQLLALPGLSRHQFAITASTLSFVEEQLGRPQLAIDLLIQAAIADVETATTETIALFKLSDFCYRRGDLKNAYTFINFAREDAAFYNARLRQIQIGGIYSTIESQRIGIIERQRRSLTIYAFVFTVLLLVVVGFAVLLFRQLRKLQRADAVISVINQELQANNQQLSDFNQRLSGLNQTLHETSRIKDEYVGYYLNASSEYIDKIERFKQALEKTLLTKQYAGTQKLVDSLNIKRERSELFRGFDQVFLKLFPNYVAAFNALLRPDEQIALADDQLLNTELRIFALIRLGIDDSERIGRILGYTVSTIYTYKTRVKKRSLYPSEEFEPRVKAIQVA